MWFPPLPLAWADASRASRDRGVFASTLSAVHGLRPADDLHVELIRYRDGGGSGSTIEPIGELVPVG